MEHEYYEKCLSDKLETFFKSEENLQVFLYIKAHRFLRIIYHGLKVAKRDNIKLYAQHLNIRRGFDKEHYDVYSRGRTIFYDTELKKFVKEETENSVVTSLGQLNFIKELLIKKNTFEYFIKNEKQIRLQLVNKDEVVEESFLSFT